MKNLNNQISPNENKNMVVKLNKLNYSNNVYLEVILYLSYSMKIHNYFNAFIKINNLKSKILDRKSRWGIFA